MTDNNSNTFLSSLFEGKNITQSSKNLYTKNLIKLNDNKPIKNLNFLTKMNVIKEKLDKYKPNTQRNYIIAIVSALKSITDKGQTKYKSLYKKYSDILDNYNKNLKDNTDKKENEKENWLSQEEVKEKYSSLFDNAMKLEKKKKLNNDDYESLLNTILLGLYVEHPPRRNKDYQKMLIVKSMPKEASENYNYLDLKTGKFIFNEYKTRSKYEKQELPINDNYMKLLKVWLKHHPLKHELKDGVYLLVDREGKSFKNVNSITNRLNRIFGKRIGSSMLRKIYLTSKYGDNAEEMKKDSEAMATSKDTISNNYIKKE